MTALAKVLLKDLLFNRDKVALLAAELAAVHAGFRGGEFVDEVVARFAGQELKQRIAWIATFLERHLPSDFRHAVQVVLRSLPAPADPALTDGDFGDFIYAPYAEFVARHGCTRQDLEFSLGALRELTMRFSVEDAIRTFINAFPDQTLRTLSVWAEDDHYHVRRLCSEGTRPRLPWSRRLVVPVAAAIQILDRLFADPTRFVTRSVANHINDIAKVDPDLAIATLERWRQSGRQQPGEMGYIIRHGTRTLVKAGHPGAMALLGITPRPRVEVVAVDMPSRVELGTALEFSVELRADQDAVVIADYAIRFAGRSGGAGGRKVFKLKQLSMSKGQRVRLSKRHPLRGDMTTRRIYPGAHEVELQINGSCHGTWPFQVIEPAPPRR